jgi:hypothetical protein
LSCQLRGPPALSLALQHTAAVTCGDQVDFQAT